MIRVPRTTPPQELVRVLAEAAARESKREEVRALATHIRTQAGDDARTAIATLVAVASAGMRKPGFDEQAQYINDDTVSVLAHGSDCSGLAIACCSLAVAAGIPARVTYTPGRAQETGLAHVYAEFKVSDEWRPADATDPRVARPAQA